MSFENKKENNEEILNKINEERNEENIEENIEENNKGKYPEDRFVKNSIDYGSCEHSSSNLPSSSGGDGENEIPIDLEENDLNELALLGFFNDFALVDIGIHEFIREVYFEE